jgi:hypothetical protein
MKDNSSKDEVSLSNTSIIPLIDKTDKLTQPRDSLNSSRNRDDINLDAERQATIQEQERIAREGSRLLDVVQSPYPNQIDLKVTTELYPSHFRFYSSNCWNSSNSSIIRKISHRTLV